MREEKKDREEITAEVHNSWFSLAIGQINFCPRINFVQPSIREKLGESFPDLCDQAIESATARAMSPKELWFATRHGSLSHDGNGNFRQHHRLLNHSVWAAMMLYIGWFFLASLLPSWRWASPSMHMELLFTTLATLGFAIRFHKTLFLSQRVAKRAVLVTAKVTCGGKHD